MLFRSKKEIINSNWQFWPDESPFELVAAMPPSARTVTLPHDAMFHEPQREDSLSKGSTGFLDGGAYKYHKSFFVPEDWKGGKVALCFEGVYRHAAVFVNQSLVGERAFGYSEFAVEIQDYLRFGGENQVLVTVKCGAQNSRWYSGAGSTGTCICSTARPCGCCPGACGSPQKAWTTIMLP